jgi:AraC-like DNA-binding protein
LAKNSIFLAFVTFFMIKILFQWRAFSPSPALTERHAHIYWQADCYESAAPIEIHAGTPLRRMEFRSGDVVIIPPFTEHRIKIDGPFSIATVRFETDDDKVFAAGGVLAIPFEREKNLFAELFRGEPPVSGSEKAAAALIVEALLLKLRGGADESPAERVGDPRLKAAVRLAAANSSSRLSLARLAREANMSPNHFIRTFKRETGETPGAFAKRLRIESARRLLRWTDLSVAQTAEQAGYPDIYSFSRDFKAQTGMSPRSFKAAAAAPAGLRKK